MRRLETYLENPFDNLYASDDNTKRFYDDHTARMHKAVADGEPFAELIPGTDAAFDTLKKAHSTSVTSRTQLKSRTTSVDDVMKLFKVKILETEPLVLHHFKKKSSAGYIEFFPQGRKGYNKLTKGNIDTLFDQVTLAFSNHINLFGEDILHEFQALKVQYDAVRDSQLEQKKDTSGSSVSWDEALLIMSKQAFANLQLIARVHHGHPEKLVQYFDQSIIAPKHHAPDIAPGQNAAAAITSQA